MVNPVIIPLPFDLTRCKDIMDILRVKKASHLSTFSVNPSKKRVKSNAVVQDDDVNENAGNQQAGSSTGAGTLAGGAKKNNNNDRSIAPTSNKK